MARRDDPRDPPEAPAARPLAVLAFALALCSTAAYVALSEGVRNFVATLGAALAGA